MDNIIEYFIREPNREFHIRELAKLSKISPTTVSKYLKQLSNRGILLSKKRYNHSLFRANAENPNFKDLKLFYNIKILRESGLINHLIDIFNHPEAIILFGSFRKAEDTPKSDIDLLIITPIKKEPNLTKFEKKLRHKIQIFLYSHQDMEKMKVKNKELLNNMINGIVLSGFWEVFR